MLKEIKERSYFLSIICLFLIFLFIYFWLPFFHCEAMLCEMNWKTWWRSQGPALHLRLSLQVVEWSPGANRSLGETPGMCKINFSNHSFAKNDCMFLLFVLPVYPQVLKKFAYALLCSEPLSENESVVRICNSPQPRLTILNHCFAKPFSQTSLPQECGRGCWEEPQRFLHGFVGGCARAGHLGLSAVSCRQGGAGAVATDGRHQHRLHDPGVGRCAGRWTCGHLGPKLQWWW